MSFWKINLLIFVKIVQLKKAAEGISENAMLITNGAHRIISIIEFTFITFFICLAICTSIFLLIVLTIMWFAPAVLRGSSSYQILVPERRNYSLQLHESTEGAYLAFSMFECHVASVRRLSVQLFVSISLTLPSISLYYLV